jgi:hypothetical protein
LPAEHRCRDRDRYPRYSEEDQRDCRAWGCGERGAVEGEGAGLESARRSEKGGLGGGREKFTFATIELLFLKQEIKKARSERIVDSNGFDFHFPMSPHSSQKWLQGLASFAVTAKNHRTAHNNPGQSSDSDPCRHRSHQWRSASMF